MVEFVNREDNERWHNNAEWFRKCRQRLHDKFAHCKSYLEDCERSGWDMSQGLPTHHWGLATDEQITELAFEMAGWGITARKVFKLQFFAFPSVKIYGRRIHTEAPVAFMTED